MVLKLISSILNPALTFWLKSQLDHSDRLTVAIDASDRALIGGTLTQIALTAERIIYQGLNLRQVQLVAEQIKTNLGQVLKGQPLELLEPINSNLHITITQADIDNSIHSPLVQKGVCDLLQQIFTRDHRSSSTVNISCEGIRFVSPQQINLRGLMDQSPFELRFAIDIIKGNYLSLDNIQLNKIDHNDWAPSPLPQQWTINLGSNCYLNYLKVDSKQLICGGSLTIMPTPGPGQSQ